ncbi:MAG: hypothetical protein AAGI89_12825 [Pseudomonadota bacterium]
MNIALGDFGEQAVLDELTSERYGYHACHFYTRGRQGIDIAAWKKRDGPSRWYDRPDTIRFIEVKSSGGDGRGNPQSLLRDFQKFGGHDFVADRLWAVGWETKEAERSGKPPAEIEIAEFREMTGGNGSCMAARNQTVSKRKLANRLLSWFHGAEFDDGVRSWIPCTSEEVEVMLGFRSPSDRGSQGLRNPIHATFELVFVPRVDLAGGENGPIQYSLPWGNRTRR